MDRVDTTIGKTSCIFLSARQEHHVPSRRDRYGKRRGITMLTGEREATEELNLRPHGLVNLKIELPVCARSDPEGGRAHVPVKIGFECR